MGSELTGIKVMKTTTTTKTIDIINRIDNNTEELANTNQDMRDLHSGMASGVKTVQEIMVADKTGASHISIEQWTECLQTTCTDPGNIQTYMEKHNSLKEANPHAGTATGWDT